MSLTLVVKSATNLPRVDIIQSIDPYCELTFHKETQWTTVKKNDQNPVWKEKIKWTLEVVPEATGEMIEVVIWDEEQIGSNRRVLKGEIPLDSVLKEGSISSLDISLAKYNPELNFRHTDAKLDVSLTYEPPVSEALETELKEAKKQIQALTTEIEDLKTENETLTKRNTNVKEKIKELSAIIDGWEEPQGPITKKRKRA